jgi:hypothetical protein
MNWEDKEPFKPKLDRLLARIDELKDEGYKVGLAASSAGASAAINAFAERQDISGVALLCGKINNPQTIGKQVYAKNPAFKESMDRLPQSLEALNTNSRVKILSIKPLTDHTVPPPDTVIKGAAQKTNPTFGHVASIAIGITLLAYRMVGFLKKPIGRSY